MKWLQLVVIVHATQLIECVRFHLCYLIQYIKIIILYTYTGTGVIGNICKLFLDSFIGMALLQDPFIVKNLTFGIEDSLISTTGVLVGVAAANFQRREILITGLILITVEALSMTYGAFLSDENFLKTSREKYATKQIIVYSLVMFFAYFIVGLILLVPYAAKMSYPSMVTVATALILLLLLIIKYEKSTKRVAVLITIGAILMTVSIFLGNHM